MTQLAHPSHNFRVEKTLAGGVTLMTLHGIIDESFEGKRVAESIRTKKAVLNIRNVRRLASWGMAEWMNFLRATEGLDLYLIECSSYAMNQMNLVTGLLGHGKLVSFYSPYRCGSCSEEFELLTLVPQDRAAILALGESTVPCATCGGRARTENYRSAWYATLAERPKFVIDDEVIGFLRSRFNYDLVPDVTRFRAHRAATKECTYIRLSGNVASLPSDTVAAASSGTTIVDLVGILFDPTDTTAWRRFVETAMPRTSSLQLLDCPPGFLEAAVRPEDLHNKLKVRTFTLVYHCPSCLTTTPKTIDVAPNLEQLAEGLVPIAHCPACQSVLTAEFAAGATSEQLLRLLPAREHDPGLDKQLARLRALPIDKLEECVAAPVKPQSSTPRPARTIYAIVAAAIIVPAALAVAAVKLWSPHDEPAHVEPQNQNTAAPQPATPTFKRPDWILSDVPSSAFCQDLINRLACVGVSSYRPNRGDAVGEANDAALEGLVNSVALKISEPFFREGVLPGYSKARDKQLETLQEADSDRASAGYRAANDSVRVTRRRVAELLQRSGGAAVPAQRSDWYWEEYAAQQGSGTEFLVFVRYDVTLDAVKALVETYATATPTLGSMVVTAFPGLAWQYADFTGGIQVTKPRGALATIGISPDEIIMAADGERFATVGELTKHVNDPKRSGDLKLVVQPTDGAVKEIVLHR